MQKVRVGIVGLGWVAQVFHLPILSKSLDVEIAAVCDRNKAQGSMIAEKFGVPAVYTDFEQMLVKEELDAVVVCTSTDAHCAVTLAALEAGKDVFVEKPIARLSKEAVQMADAARLHKRKLMVGMNNRFRPDTMILKNFIEKGELGKIFYCKAGWFKHVAGGQTWITKKDVSGGGVMLDLGIVMLDLSLWMLGFPNVERVSASTYKHTTKSVEDSAVVYIGLKGGSTLLIETSWSFQSEEYFFYCNLYGTEGSAMINPLRINKHLHGNLVNVTPAKLETPQNLHKRSYENELRHFIGAVRGLNPVVSSGEEAVKRMTIIDAVYSSAKKSKEITF